MPRFRSRAFEIANFVAAALFATSAALQYNDPDPVRWALLYGGAAAACLTAMTSTAPWALPALVGIVALVWAGILAPQALPGLEISRLAESMKAETPSIELGRELFGVLIVAAWMAALVVASARRAAQP